MLITEQKNTFLADLGAIFKGWFGEAAGLLKADLMVEGKTPHTTAGSVGVTWACSHGL